MCALQRVRLGVHLVVQQYSWSCQKQSEILWDQAFFYAVSISSLFLPCRKLKLFVSWGRGKEIFLPIFQHEFRATLNLEKAEGVFIFPNFSEVSYLDLSSFWFLINSSKLAERQDCRTCKHQSKSRFLASSGFFHQSQDLAVHSR